jgi:DNA-binding LacI/PurR family transcriptional regulator
MSRVRAAAIGRRVQDDVSVVGFDDQPEAAYVRPALTTIHHDIPVSGREAVETLQLAAGGKEPSN